MKEALKEQPILEAPPKTIAKTTPNPPKFIDPSTTINKLVDHGKKPMDQHKKTIPDTNTNTNTNTSSNNASTKNSKTSSIPSKMPLDPEILRLQLANDKLQQELKKTEIEAANVKQERSHSLRS